MSKEKSHSDEGKAALTAPLPDVPPYEIVGGRSAERSPSSGSGTGMEKELDQAALRALTKAAEGQQPGARVGIGRATITTLFDVMPEKLSWLWPCRIPAGKVIVLDGDPSVGKSTVATDWAARITTGTRWPDGQLCPIGDVLIMSAEDGLADTIRPRLDAAGGDPKRVHAITSLYVITGHTDTGDATVAERPITLADTDAIREAITESGAIFLIVDVLMAYLPSSADAHKDQAMRGVLSRLAEIADETGCTILVLRHLNKGRGGGVAMYAGGGSIGIVGAARAAYMIARDPDDPEKRVLAVVKSNLGPEPPSLAYRLVQADGDDVAHVEWLGESEHDAAGLLATSGGDDDQEDRDEAEEWLTQYLASNGGEAPAGKVIGDAAKAGLAKHTVQRARKRIKAVTRKGSMGGGWVWALPTNGDENVVRLQPEGDTEEDEEHSSMEPSSSSPSLSPSLSPTPIWAACDCGNHIFREDATRCARCEMKPPA